MNDGNKCNFRHDLVSRWGFGVEFTAYEGEMIKDHLRYTQFSASRITIDVVN